MNNNSIGFFDSGIGGITIWESVNRLLPNENTIYLADSNNSPYGTKSYDELSKIVNDWLNGEDENDEGTEKYGGNSEKTETPTKTSGNGKTYNDLDDAFADLVT